MGKENRAAVLAFLQQQGVAYTLVEHEPALDMADIQRLGVSAHGHVAKNLFLRDSKKGRHHFLVTVRGDKTVDLQRLGQALGQRLSFASEARLKRHLRLEKGEVSPLAALFDEDNAVQVVLDADLAAFGAVGVHPADNTATVFLAFGDLQRAVAATGSPVQLATV